MKDAIERLRNPTKGDADWFCVEHHIQNILLLSAGNNIWYMHTYTQIITKDASISLLYMWAEL